MNRIPLILAVSGLLAAATAHGQLAITEIMSLGRI
jgi:hypothetical protein